MIAVEDPGRSARRLEAVHAIVDAASEPLQLDELLAALLDRLRRVLDADNVTILLREGERLVVRASTGLQAEVDARVEIPLGHGIAGAMALGRRARIIDDVRTEPEVWSPILRARIRSMVVVPLLYGDSVIGVLHAGSETERDFRGEVVLLELVAERAASAIERVRAETERARQGLRAALLADLSHRLMTEFDSQPRVLRTASEQISSALEAGCAFYLSSDDGRGLNLVALHHPIPEYLDALRAAIAQQLSPRAPDVASGVDALSVEMRAHGEVFGLVVLARVGDGSVAWPEDDRAFVAELAARTAAALDHARVRRRLQASEQRFRTLFDSARVGFVARDRDGRVVEANEAYAKMLGYENPESMLGTGLDTIAGPDGLADLTRRFFAMLGGDAEHMEVQNAYRREDGTIVHGQISSSVVRDIDRRPLYLFSVVEDVTERHQLEEQLRQSQKMDALGRFAGAIAHDFNNILTAIGGFSQLIASELDTGHPLHAEVGEIVEATGRAAALTRQLLTFSRHEVSTPEILNAGDIVQRIAPMLGRLLGETIDLVLDLTATNATIEADRHQIEQVIVNLAVNARDAMPSGGRLSIEVTTADIDDAYARTHLSLDPGSYVVIAICDTGHGIDADDQVHIFEPFFTTKPAGEGTGLGLSTVFGIVRQAGGTISVYSEPGHGTTFRIHLPRIDSPASAGPSYEKPAAIPAARAATVLVIDDEPPVRRIIERLLTRRGYTVLLAEDGEQALSLADQQPGPIDLLITDIVLPGITGPEIAQRLTERRPQIKVLYTSGYPGDELVRRGLKATAAFVGKPFTLDEFERTVSQLLEPPPGQQSP